MTTITFEPHEAGRKKLTGTIANLLGVAAVYAGTPSFAYQIGQATLDRHWTLTLPDGVDAKAVRQAAAQAGFTTITTSGTTAPTSAGEAGEIGLTVVVPADGWTSRTRANLGALLAAKGDLIARALKIEATPVEFTCDTVVFPWFATMPSKEVGEAAAWLITALCDRAATATRIRSKPPVPGNDKYTMRCFLISLGCIGPEHKTTRKVLLANLEGDSAWRTPPSGERDIAQSHGK
ncbi:hypothetical protein [Trueperella bialowiezensis]|uniref:Virulence protein n=1 Tax=Trueperella bialowiezensis TaxID=312285 RepID=A0A448PG21_9ACTO|nr:hypothetical protein [Trueperella bialowiezensis]VEI13860.1 Uncharacterised protein [Trueperella bialowiezensis]